MTETAPEHDRPHLIFGEDDTPEQIESIVSEYVAVHTAILRDQREELELEFEAREAELGARPKADNDNDPAGPKGAPLPVMCPADWHGLPVPEREWFVPDLIPSRQVTILTGDGGVGKSLVALQIGAAACLGLETIGLSPKPCRVLYLGAEDEAEEFHRRLADIVAAHDRTLADLVDFRLIPLADRDALLATPDVKGVMQPTANFVSLTHLVAKHTPGVVFLDTSADLYGGDEIKRGQVRQFVSMLRGLAIQWNCAVVLLSHPSVSGMQTGSGSSGSTGWNNSVRSRLYLTRPESKDADLRLLKTVKANYGAIGDEKALRWRAGAFVLDDGKPAEEVAFVTKRHDDVFLSVLRKLIGQGVNVTATPCSTYAPTVFLKHPEAKGLKREQLADAMRRLMDAGHIRMVTEGSKSRQRSRLEVSE